MGIRNVSNIKLVNRSKTAPAIDDTAALKEAEARRQTAKLLEKLQEGFMAGPNHACLMTIVLPRKQVNILKEALENWMQRHPEQEQRDNYFALPPVLEAARRQHRPHVALWRTSEGIPAITIDVSRENDEGRQTFADFSFLETASGGVSLMADCQEFGPTWEQFNDFGDGKFFFDSIFRRIRDVVLESNDTLGVG